MIRVLHLRSSGAILGAENVIIELAKSTSEFGYESVIGAINNDDDPFPEFLNAAKSAGIETVLFSGKGRVDLKRLSLIKNYVQQNNIPVIHSHGYKEDFYSILLPRKIRKIATNHLWKKTSFLDTFYSFLDVVFLQFFDSVVGVSSEIVNSMRSVGLHRLEKIPNGVDCYKFKPQLKSAEFLNKFMIKPDKTVIGMISSLSPEKGHEIALKAIELISNANLLLAIVGDGPLKTTLIEHVENNDLSERVIFLGKQYQIPEVLSVFDIFILPSFKEGLPMALLEAMASEKAVIASSVGEIPNVIIDKKNGLLINPGKPQELADAINFLLGNSEYSKKMSIAARTHIVENYSAKKMAKKYCQLYDHVIKMKKNF